MAAISLTVGRIRVLSSLYEFLHQYHQQTSIDGLCRFEHGRRSVGGMRLLLRIRNPRVGHRCRRSDRPRSRRCLHRYRRLAHFPSFRNHFSHLADTFSFRRIIVLFDLWFFYNSRLLTFKDGMQLADQ